MLLSADQLIRRRTCSTMAMSPTPPHTRYTVLAFSRHHSSRRRLLDGKTARSEAAATRNDSHIDVDTKQAIAVMANIVCDMISSSSWLGRLPGQKQAGKQESVE
jgi:hypothetical protein